MSRNNSLYESACRAGRVALLAAVAATPMAGCAEKADQTTAAVPVPGDYLVVMNRPNKLNLVDLKQRKVANSCDLPGDFGPGTVAMSPDQPHGVCPDQPLREYLRGRCRYL